MYAITDEVYEHIVYDGRKMVYMSVASRHVGADSQSCSSLSKTYSVTGWRLGYAIAPQPIMDRIKQYHDFNTVGAPSPLMEAAVVGLEMPDSYYREFGDHYAHMKEIFTGGMKELGIPFTDPEGTYFVLADIAPYMKKGQSDVEFCVEMAQKVGRGMRAGQLVLRRGRQSHRPAAFCQKGRNAAVCARPAEPPQADHVRLSVVYCVLLPIYPVFTYKIIPNNFQKASYGDSYEAFFVSACS